MRKIILLFIGLIYLFSFKSEVMAANTVSGATDYCDPANYNSSSYWGIYCDLRTNGGLNAETDIFEAVGEQLAYDPDLVKEIIRRGDVVCADLRDLVDIEEMPVALQGLCMTDEEKRPFCEKKNDPEIDIEERAYYTNVCDTQRTLVSTKNIAVRTQNAYNKEKALYYAKKELEFQFKASEKYWDGRLGGAAGAPLAGALDSDSFDLMVDLNLIEQMLFGSRAVWTNDVFAFPLNEEEGAGGGNGEDGDFPDSGDNENEGGDDSSVDEDGVNVDFEEEGEGGPDCVPADDPNADTSGSDDNGGDDDVFGGQECGNGILDVLLGETCDDGNREAGDGCNQACVMESSGASQTCSDPDAVTFRELDSDGSGGSGGNGSENENDSGEGNDNDGSRCPPGFFPRKDTDITGPDGEQGATVAQQPSYPGPFIGGTLKQFPASVAPPCPVGQSPLALDSIDLTAFPNVGGNRTQIACMPTELCVDPDEARDFIAQSVLGISGDWRDLEEGDTRKETLKALELMFCVNITTANRPISPYVRTEGCIDCHIRSMVDSAEKALLTNVGPLENTTSAFGISNRFAPNFSFDLNLAVKKIVKTVKVKRESSPSKKTYDEVAKSEKIHTPVASNLPIADSANATLSRNANVTADALNKIKEDLKIYELANAAITDTSFGARVVPLFIQMKTVFGSIQDSYITIASTAEKLANKDQCVP